MAIRVLIVEDDEDFVEELKLVLGTLDGPPEVTVARGRNTALDHIEKEFFDLLVLDLKIPTADSALDANPAHGRLVFNNALKLAPGMPIFVLTGSPAEDFIPELLEGARQIDIWGEGCEVRTVNFLTKSKFAESKDKLSPFAAAVARLSEVEFERGDTDLGIEDDRLVRIFARRVGGVRCIGSLIGGGLSSAKVVRLKVTGTTGARIHDAVVKLAPIHDTRDETKRFDSHISRLDPAATPRKLQTLEFGAKARAAIFYGLADGFEFDAFDICTRAGNLPATLVKNVKEATRNWWDTLGETPKTIREIRRRLISDDDLRQATAPHSILWINDFESKQIQTRWCSVHGDLHGGNVLSTKKGDCVLIDYGDVGDGPACLDAITLELSTLFHPKHPLRGTGWPTAEQSNNWADLHKYLGGCPAVNFITACREWALSVAAGRREVAAGAYAYLVRQLKYADTDKDLALALLNALHIWFMSTT
jgi:CheY-like chemotaxis protein